MTVEKIKCVAIDDEPLALELLANYIARCPELELVQSFQDAISASEFLNEHAVPLIFIDINMPDITGLDLVRALKNKPMVIFTTAHKKFAHEGFELDAIDYLLKPINFERFRKAVTKAIDYHEYRHRQDESKQDSLFVYTEYRLLRIRFDEITYIESLEDYIRIHLKGSKPIMTLMTLKSVLEKLPAEKFKRIHRSYIVAVDSVSGIKNRKAIIGGLELPISDTYSSFINEWKGQ